MSRPGLRDTARSVRDKLVARAVIENTADRQRVALGALQCRLARVQAPTTLHDAEFQVFSQWGEDGVIQYLADRVPIPTRTFVEIGVEDYTECNTRFLAQHSNWSGLAIDGGTAHADTIRRAELDWRYGVLARSAFVTRDNINGLISDAGISGDIGLLSLDIDGVDYWILQALDVVSPRILVLEYNSAFGADHAVTVPYRSDFSAWSEHYSFLYWGASLPALVSLAQSKGYEFVGCESHGANAFFVRTDVAGDLPRPALTDGFQAARSRIARDVNGALTMDADPRVAMRTFADKPLIRVPEGTSTTVGATFGL